MDAILAVIFMVAGTIWCEWPVIQLSLDEYRERRRLLEREADAIILQHDPDLAAALRLEDA